MSADLRHLLRDAAGPTPDPDIDAILGRAARRRRARWTAVATVAALAVGFGVGSQALLPSGTTVTADQPDTTTSHTLDATGPATVVGAGEIDGAGSWQLVAYPVAPAAGRTEPRFCTEFRGTADGPQSCFPIITPDSSGWSWSFTERHLGRIFLVVVAQPGASLQLDNRQLTAAPGQEELPLRVFTAELPDDPSYSGWLASDSGSGQLVGVSGFVEADGARELLSHPAIPGVELERLVSHNPAADGWVTVGGTGGEDGYLNPSDLGAPSMQQPSPTPVYGRDGEQIGVIGPCGFQTDQDAPCENVPTSTVDEGGE